MKKNITMDDIANALHISRNTVSKALNGKHVPSKTRAQVLNAAINMGYKSYGLVSSSQIELKENRILILSSVSLLAANYYIYLLKGIMAEAENKGYEILQYIFRPHSDIESLKEYIKQFKVGGIICIEFFNKKNIFDIISLETPIVFLDFISNDLFPSGNFDILLPENIFSVKNSCLKSIEKGVRHFSFVGPKDNCKSFYERFLGMREALFESDLPFESQFSIISENAPYADSRELAKILKHYNFDQQRCFVCANDFIALNVIDALRLIKKLNLDKVQVIGYDNTPESRLNSPKLSTINVDKFVLGKTAVEILTERMCSKNLPAKIIYIDSNYIERETTSQKTAAEK